MVCGYFILPEPASYVFFYAIFNLRNLLDLLTKWRADPFCGKIVIGGMQHDGTPK